MPWNYYCSTDQPSGPENGCHWCGNMECHEVFGVDDFWLCDNCEEYDMTSTLHSELSRLFKEDPEAFEKKAKELVEETISSASPNVQLSLRAIQAKFDAQMKKAGSQENRLTFAIDMLMDKFQEMSKALGELNDKA